MNCYSYINTGIWIPITLKNQRERLIRFNTKMEGVVHRTVEVNGIKMHVAEKGEGPVVLFLHGFPELWYSWRGVE